MHKDCANRVPGSLHNSFRPAGRRMHITSGYLAVKQRNQDARTSALNMRPNHRIASGDSPTSITSRWCVATPPDVREPIQDLTSPADVRMHAHTSLKRRIFRNVGENLESLDYEIASRLLGYFTVKLSRFLEFVDSILHDEHRQFQLYQVCTDLTRQRDLFTYRTKIRAALAR